LKEEQLEQPENVPTPPNMKEEETTELLGQQEIFDEEKEVAEAELIEATNRLLDSAYVLAMILKTESGPAEALRWLLILSLGATQEST
jgi:hypothetical protein